MLNIITTVIVFIVIDILAFLFKTDKTLGFRVLVRFASPFDFRLRYLKKSLCNVLPRDFFRKTFTILFRYFFY